MAIASAIGFVKFFMLAAWLSPSEFALYAAIFAAVRFVAELVAFGRVDVTVKRFPRLILLGNLSRIGHETLRLTWVLAATYLCLTIIAGVATHYVGPQEAQLVCLGLAGLAFATNLFSLSSSVLRALGALPLFALTAIVRSALSVLAIALVVSAGWISVLIAESVALVTAGLVILVVALNRLARQEAAADSPLAVQSKDNADSELNQVSRRRDGPLLFVSFMVSLIPISMDRFVVTWLETAQVAALYAFCGIWLTGAYTVVAIYNQKFGPEIVQQAALNPGTCLRAYCLRRMMAVAVILFSGSLVTFLGLWFFFHETYWARYSLGPEFVIFATLAATAQAVTVFDWALVARDREPQLFLGSCFFFVTLATGFAITFAGEAGYLGYAMSIFVARLTQGLWQYRALGTRPIDPTPSISG